MWPSAWSRDCGGWGSTPASAPRTTSRSTGASSREPGAPSVRHALVYHGTLLTDFDVDTMLQCLRLPISKLDDKQVQGFRQRVTCLRELLGTTPPLPATQAGVGGRVRRGAGRRTRARRSLGRRARGVERAHALLRVRGVDPGQPRPRPGERAGHGRSQDPGGPAARGHAGRPGPRRRQGRLHQRRLLRAARSGHPRPGGVAAAHVQPPRRPAPPGGIVLRRPRRQPARGDRRPARRRRSARRRSRPPGVRAQATALQPP